VLARVLSAALVGVEAVLVRVEVDVASGLPAWLQENQGKHRCQCGCEEVIRLQPRHFWRGVPQYVHGHQNCRGQWRVLQLKQARYLTTPDVARALGIGVTTLRRREGTIYPQAARIGGIRSITRQTSSCSGAGTRPWWVLEVLCPKQALRQMAFGKPEDEGVSLLRS
jgi:hypothetical protein